MRPKKVKRLQTKELTCLGSSISKCQSGKSNLTKVTYVKSWQSILAKVTYVKSGQSILAKVTYVKL
jgi:hypothetical protein